MSGRPETVVICAQVDDRSADAVITDLNRRGVPVARFDPITDFPGEVTLAAETGGGKGLHGRITTPSRVVDLALVRAVYHRRASGYGAAFAHLAEPDARFAAAQARHGLGGVLAALDCRHVCHPHAVRAASDKPAQLAVAQRLGFTVPPTLVTSDPDAARAFAREHGSVVYKVLRTSGYTDPAGNPLTVWTSRVHAEDITDDVAGSAHLFQAEVKKTADWRVIVAGRSVFTVRIATDPPLLDWRSDYTTHTYTPVDRLPAGMTERLHAYLDHFGLSYGAFDFCVTAEGEPVWMECNPTGQWGWLEAATGLPIAAALADLLEGTTR